MDKISINLIPGEVISLERNVRRNLQIFRLSLVVLLGMLTLTATLLVLRFIQNQALGNENAKLDTAKQRVSQYKTQESQIVYLKQRLVAISGVINQDFKASDGYNLITTITPPSVKLSSVSLTKDGNITLSAQASDLNTLQNFFDNLGSSSINQGKISSVSIDNLTRSTAGDYRVDLTISII